MLHHNALGAGHNALDHGVVTSLDAACFNTMQLKPAGDDAPSAPHVQHRLHYQMGYHEIIDRGTDALAVKVCETAQLLLYRIQDILWNKSSV